MIAVSNLFFMHVNNFVLLVVVVFVCFVVVVFWGRRGLGGRTRRIRRGERG